MRCPAGASPNRPLESARERVCVSVSESERSIWFAGSECFRARVSCVSCVVSCVSCMRARGRAGFIPWMRCVALRCARCGALRCAALRCVALRGVELRSCVDACVHACICARVSVRVRLFGVSVREDFWYRFPGFMEQVSRFPFPHVQVPAR